MADFDTQINVGMNVDGVVSGTEKAKRSLKTLGEAARESGKSVEGMGDGGGKAADKVEAATRNMIGSIQRQTAALEAGDKSSRKYQESLAKMRGVDVSALKPYLDQLDSVKAKQDAAAKSAAQMTAAYEDGQKIGEQLRNGFVAMAAAAAAALAATGLVLDQLIKKAGDFQDLAEKTGDTAQNVASLALAAGTAGISMDAIVGAASKLTKGLSGVDDESKAAGAAIAALGLDLQEFKALGPTDQIEAVAKALDGFEDGAKKSAVAMALFGKSGADMMPFLKELGAEGGRQVILTQEQIELADEYADKQAKLTAELGLHAQAIASQMVPAYNLFVEALIEASKEVLGIDSAISGMTKADDIKNFANESALLLANLADIGYDVAGAFRFVGDNLGAMAAIAVSLAKGDLAGAQAIGRASDENNARILKGLGLAEKVQARIDAINKSASKVIYVDPRSLGSVGTIAEQDSANNPKRKLQFEGVTAATKDAAKATAEYSKEISAQNKLIAENAGLSGSFTEDWERLTAIFKSGKYNIEQLTAAQAKLLSAQPAIKAFNDAELKAAEAIEKAMQAAFDAREKYAASLTQGLEKLQQETASQQEYIDQLGLSKVAIAEINAEKLEAQAVALDLIAIKVLERTEDEALYDLYKKQSAELRKQASLKVQGANRDAQLETAKEVAAEFKRGWEETDRLARDVFSSWATDGGNAAQKIGDTLKKALLSAIYEATLKPIVMQVYGSIAGGGAGGVAGTALQAASGGGNVLSGLSTAFGNTAGVFGQGFKAGFGAVFGEAGTMGGLSAGTTAIGAGNIAGGLGTLAGTIAPYLAAFSLIKSLTDYKVESLGNGLTATIGGAGGLPSGSVGRYNEFAQTSSGIGSGGNTINRDWSKADQGVADYIAGNVKNITASNKAYANALGLTSGSIDSFTKSIEVNLTGLDAAGQQAAINAELTKFAGEQAASAFGSSVAAFAKSGESTAQTLQRLGGDLTATNAMFKTLGYSLFDISAAGASAASTLIEAFGGLANAQQQLGSFQENYYSQAERDDSTYVNAQAALAKAGIDYSIDQLRAATREDIRAVVDELARIAGGSGSTQLDAAALAAAIQVANGLAGLKPTTTAPSTPTGPTSAPGGGFEPYSPEWYAHGGGYGGNGQSSNSSSGGGDGGGAAAIDPNIAAAQSLQEQLDQLTLSAIELHKKQIDAQREILNESNKLLFDQVQAAQLAQTNQGFQDRIDVLTGVTTDRALSLQRDLAAATDVSTQALINLVYSLEDMQTASESAIAAAKDAYSNAQTGTDKAYAALERSVAAQRTVAQEAITNAKAVIDSVAGAVKGLFSQVDSVVQSEAAKGLAFIDNALASAQATGYLPDPKDLNKAIGQATGGIDKTQFTSQADADFARLVLAGKLNALGDLAEPQLSAAEATLKTLEETLETARAQIDALRGIDNSVKSVEEAIRLLAAAMAAESAAKAASAIPVGGTVPFNPIGTSYVGMGSDIKTIQDLYSVNLGREADAAGAAYWSARFLGDGVISADERQQFAIASLDEYRSRLPALAVGTNYIPYDGFQATLHEGEAVVPKAYNPAAGGSVNAELVAEIRALRNEVQSLKMVANTGNVIAQRTANAVNGSPDMPMLVETV